MSRAPSILFVCLGNICRSPLAEGALRHLAGMRGIDLAIDSAGTGDWHVGEPPDARAIAAARAHGVDIAGLRARQVERADFTRFSHIYALDRQNLIDLQSLAPAASRARLALLLDEVAGLTGADVADPHWGGPEDFLRTWREVSQAAQAILDALDR